MLRAEAGLELFASVPLLKQIAEATNFETGLSTFNDLSQVVTEFNKLGDLKTSFEAMLNTYVQNTSMLPSREHHEQRKQQILEYFDKTTENSSNVFKAIVETALDELQKAVTPLTDFATLLDAENELTLEGCQESFAACAAGAKLKAVAAPFLRCMNFKRQFDKHASSLEAFAKGSVIMQSRGRLEGTESTEYTQALTKYACATALYALLRKYEKGDRARATAISTVFKQKLLADQLSPKFTLFLNQCQKVKGPRATEECV